MRNGFTIMISAIGDAFKKNMTPTHNAKFGYDMDIRATRQAFGIVPDLVLGHRLFDGQDFIGEKDFISLEEQLKEIRSSKKKIILNIGDSSTSGWDFNVQVQNINRVKKGLDIKPAFFKYKTYSDLLRDAIGDAFIVINAGVPAYSSLQGAKRLKILLKFFKQHQVKICYVTSYFGNNDSSWWISGEDKLWVGKSIPDNYSLEFIQSKILEKDQIITRVLPNDYRINLMSILNHCLSAGAIPIFIEPVTPIYWKPGIYDKNQWVSITPFMSRAIKEHLDESLHLWEVAIKEKKYSKMKELLLEEAREKDYVMPRIKKSHLKVLREVAAAYKIPYATITLDRSEDDARYFMDSCHPIGDANEFLADSIKQLVVEFEQGKRKSTTQLPRNPQSIKNSPAIKASTIETPMPLAHYPLY